MHFEFGDIVVGLSDMLLGPDEMVSHLFKLKVESVDLLHQEYYLEGFFAILFDNFVYFGLVDSCS